MNILAKAIWFFIDLVLPLIVGYALKRRVSIKANTLERIMMGDLVILVTILGVLSFWVLPLRINQVWLPVIALVTMAAAGGLGAMRAKFLYTKATEQGGYVLASMLSNRNTAGTITVFLLLGEEGYGYTRLFVCLQWLFVYMVAFPIGTSYFQKEKGGHGGQISILKAIIDWKQVPILGMGAGAILHYAGMDRPGVLGAVFPWLVHLSVWLFLVPLGYSIDFAKIKAVSHDWGSLLFIKFLATPLLAYVLAIAAGINGVALATVLLLAATPSAIQSVVVARLTKLSSQVAMGAFILTTFVYLVLIISIILLVWYSGAGLVAFL